MSPKIRRAIAAALISVVPLASCASTEQTEIVTTSYYPVIFDSVDTLIDATDILVEATIVSTEVRELDVASQASDPTESMANDPDTNPDLGAVGDSPIPEFATRRVYTYLTLDVHKSSTAYEGSITMRIPGGELRGTLHETDVFPVLQEGQRYTLALVEVESGIYALVNPGQSAYIRAKDGSLVPVSKTAMLWNADLSDSDEKSAEAFETELTSRVHDILFMSDR